MPLFLPPVTLSLMAWVNLERGSLLEKEYRKEWGNERLRVGNDSRKGTPGARWLHIIWKFFSHPCLPMLFLSLVPTLSLSQMGLKKLLLNFLTSRQKKKSLVYFCLPTQLLPRCLGFASILHLFSGGWKWTGSSREWVTGESTKSRVTNEVQVCGQSISWSLVLQGYMLKETVIIGPSFHTGNDFTASVLVRKHIHKKTHS